MRICPRCNQEKEATDFYNRRNKEGTSAYCKVCTNQQTIERQRNLKKQAVIYKGGKCIVCSYVKYEGALEFHHLDPTQKDFSLSHCHLTSFNKIKPELDKCVLVCSNCHRELHANLIKL